MVNYRQKWKFDKLTDESVYCHVERLILKNAFSRWIFEGGEFLCDSSNENNPLRVVVHTGGGIVLPSQLDTLDSVFRGSISDDAIIEAICDNIMSYFTEVRELGCNDIHWFFDGNSGIGRYIRGGSILDMIELTSVFISKAEKNGVHHAVFNLRSGWVPDGGYSVNTHAGQVVEVASSDYFYDL